MAFVVIYDACVLHPELLRNFLLRIAQKGIVRARWTSKILDETFDSLQKRRPDLDPQKLQRTRERIIGAVPDCLVEGYETIVDGLLLPDPNDRHVLAAAIRAGAQSIVTFNLRDFPDAMLARYDIEPRHPDDFVADQLGLAPGLIVNVVLELAQSLNKPRMSVADLLARLRDQGLGQSVAKLNELFGVA